MPDIDVLIVGAGMAGASLAAELAPHRLVLIVEAEDVPGFHATGRSAAFWHESYGGPLIQPLSRAGYDVLAAPVASFSDRPFLSPRSAITIARASERDEIEAFAADFGAADMVMTRLGRPALERAMPGLRDEWTDAILEPACSDIDVAGLHAAYLGAARHAGAELRTKTTLEHARRGSNGFWHVRTNTGDITAAVIVDAAGAWADCVAERCGVEPIGVTPFRRTVVQLRLEKAVPASLPLVIHVGGEFYIKGESEGRIWVSPHDETPDQAHDVVPEELDVAIAIDRFEHLVDWPIAAVERRWAGLRSFAPDRLPVIGFDPDAAGFYWLAGQGGFGIQTAPAIARIAAADLAEIPPHSSMAGIDVANFSPARLR